MNKFKILTSPELGRYAIASEDIQAGEIILDELPFVYGPKQSTAAICLGCYCPVNSGAQGPRCTKCHWPLCNNCEIVSKDHKPECDVFSSAKVKFQPVENPICCQQMDCITPLRMLLKKEADPDRWENEISLMEYHDDNRRAMKDIWNADLVNIAKYLRGPCKLKQFSEDLIMQVIGILEINAFEARTAEGYPIRCVFPKTAILAHDCVPNVMRSIYPSDGFRAKLRAAVGIKENDQINICYTFTLNGTFARQSHLKSGKYFTCRCKRCSDPTELGTHFSSFICKRCDSGFLSVVNPFDEQSEWKCSSCTFTTSSNSIQNAINIMKTEISDIQDMEFRAQKLENAEKLLEKYGKVLHPSHYIQMSLTEILIEMYGRVEGYKVSQLPPDKLQRKLLLCQSLLNILDIFEPGLSRARAMILYELQTVLLTMLKKSYTDGSIGNHDLKSKLLKVINILEECVLILEDEDPVSYEGILADVAKQTLLKARKEYNVLNK